MALGFTVKRLKLLCAAAVALSVVSAWDVGVAGAAEEEWQGAAKEYWAYQKPVSYERPKVDAKDWPRAEMDYFILAKLEEAGLAPSADAAPQVLLRRLYFDVIGLPPTPARRRDFAERARAEGLDAAMEAEVEALLASERFGERWGRHWLDVARYAESSGKDSNFTFPYAWRYRDYVIDSVNADKPFDRFVTEQIAGDLLPCQDEHERATLMIATGYLALGPKGLNEPNDEVFRAEEVDEQIDAVTRGVLASSVACARCHDHPSDPFTMEDYYAMAGIFKSTDSRFGTSIGPNNQVGGRLMELPGAAGAPILHPSVKPEQVQKMHDEMAALDEEEKMLRETRQMTIQNALRIIWRRGALTGRLEKYDSTGVARPLVMGVRDGEAIADTPLLERGELTKPRDVIPRRFPSIVELNEKIHVPKDRSGRLELARWLTQPDHPLTGRVMANRVWRKLFGVGLVRTVDQFGASGERPSHPQLLDHLAVAFVQDGWSIKKLIRRVVLSRTYRQASTYRDAAFETDPDNRLVWRVSKRRLDAEAIRDAMLHVSGELDTQRPVGSLVGVIGDKPISIIGFDKRMRPDIDGTTHRSVYLPVMRDKLPDVLELFDFAEPSMVTGDRATTNVPLQSLYLLNSEFVTDRAAGLAKRVMKEAGSNQARTRLAFELCFGRAPDRDENEMADAFLSRGAALGADELETLSGYCQALLCAGEFRYVD
ncbi:MAG: DUF1549 and DUF1553 domain-containing protein [Planctomycetota bacterium]|jgi:hypothetical protein